MERLKRLMVSASPLAKYQTMPDDGVPAMPMSPVAEVEPSVKALRLKQMMEAKLARAATAALGTYTASDIAADFVATAKPPAPAPAPASEFGIESKAARLKRMITAKRAAENVSAATIAAGLVAHSNSAVAATASSPTAALLPTPHVDQLVLFDPASNPLYQMPAGEFIGPSAAAAAAAASAPTEDKATKLRRLLAAKKK